VGFFEDTIAALNRADVRYVVVGGVAVVLHGHIRVTFDLDLVVDLTPPEARKAIEALMAAGLRPRVPEDAIRFADPAVRERWIQQKGMTVFSLWDPQDPTRSADLFVEEPIEFEVLWSRSLVLSLESTEVRVASIPDLIEMKRAAGRPHDLADIQALEAILEENPDD
jgi:nucleotidyltransferase AbiEii toxin of type IV toxin-antitoxin system